MHATMNWRTCKIAPEHHLLATEHETWRGQLISDIPKPTTRPLAAAAIGANALSALNFDELTTCFNESGIRESICAGVGGGDLASNVNDAGVSTPGRTTVTLILASRCLTAFHGSICCSRNISSRRSKATFPNGDWNSPSSDDDGTRTSLKRAQNKEREVERCRSRISICAAPSVTVHSKAAYKKIQLRFDSNSHYRLHMLAMNASAQLLPLLPIVRATDKHFRTVSVFRNKVHRVRKC